MRTLAILSIIAAAVLSADAHAQTPAKSTVAKKSAPGTAAAKSTAKSTNPKSTVVKTSPATSRTGISPVASKKAPPNKSKKQAAAPRRPPTQQQPTVERYKEIQQALADRGYFRGATDGTWGLESTDALKRFQREQNLDPDGKIGALSLIALGLGSKRGASSPQASEAAVDSPPVARPEP